MGGGSRGVGEWPAALTTTSPDALIFFFLSKLISTAFIDVNMCFSFLTLYIFNLHFIIFNSYIFPPSHCTFFAALIVKIPPMWDQ